MNHSQWVTLITLAGLATLHMIGVLSVAHVLMRGRTAQGTIAWIVCMIVAPWLAIPFYWTAGRQKFAGYNRDRQAADGEVRRILEKMHRRLRDFALTPSDAFARAAEILGGLPFTSGNSIKLLVDGRQTFDAIFGAIREAQDYILINFFIVKNDRIGGKFKDALIARAREGVKIYFLFDEVGSYKLSRAYLRELRHAGIEWRSFGTNRHWWSRLQVNFRNHRKIVICDGKVGFLGGLNVGDEYLGHSKRFGRWRDTHLRLEGPCVQAIQLVFVEDWKWASNEYLNLCWQYEKCQCNQVVAILPTGPSDRIDSWHLTIAEACATAVSRIWITSPYFVPDDAIITALRAAALRGVDIRILIPENPDHLLVWLAAFSYYEETIPYGIRLFRYQAGFLHQKVMLIDRSYAFVGTANLDNRSFRLNFEITAISTDGGFITQVETMLEEDFAQTRECRIADFRNSHLVFRVAARAARLFSPLL